MSKVSQVSIRLRILKESAVEPEKEENAESFTGVDPFEDTERCCTRFGNARSIRVSQVSIRLRILKGAKRGRASSRDCCFTGVDPFEDTESITRG